VHQLFFSAQPSQSHEEELDADSAVPPPFPALRHHHHHDDNKISHSYRNSQAPKIGRLILVRHGQSKWNVTDPTRNLTARFTGWADIGLTQQGKDQALAAGRAIQLAVNNGILPPKDRFIGGEKFIVPAIDVVFCSLLKRSIDTMNLILEEIYLAEKVSAPTTASRGEEESPKYQYPIPVIHSWRLNERHYGALVGLSKQGAERLYGRVRLTRWRDSWDVRPPPMPLEMVKRWGREDHCKPVTIVKEGGGGRMCVFDPSSVKFQRNINAMEQINSTSGDGRISGMKIVEHGGKKRKDSTTSDINNDNAADEVNFMPPSESLHDTHERFLPLWKQGIAPHLRAGRTVLVVGHANTIRSMLFAIDGDVATKENAKKLKVPSALPVVYELCDGSADIDCFEVDDGDSRGQSIDMTDEIQADGTIEPTRRRRYRLNGKEVSEIVPGNLRVLKPQAATKGRRNDKDELRHHLSGVWIETDETKSVSFCTDLGKEMGEQDIA
jgi:bisphosphoglycerate-dependent phosphoglycerate mutase